jgi:hypothetical protein
MSWKLGARASALTLAPAVLTAGCDWREFDEYEETAPIRVYEAPVGRLEQYGWALASFETGSKSVVVASSGANSPVVFQRMWNGSRLSDETIIRCKRPEDCQEANGLGATLIPFPVWAHGTAQERTGCVLAPGTPKAYVFCDSNTSNNQSWDLDVAIAEGSTARFAGVGLPAGHELGVAILGVHGVTNRGQLPGEGRLYYQPDFQPAGLASDADEVPLLVQLPLRDPASGLLFEELERPADLGFAIAAAENRQGELVIAISQPSHERVIVATYDASLDGESGDKLRTRACLHNPAPALVGFGKRLLVGDIDDDGAPEIFVGIDPTDAEHRASGRSAVYMYRGAGLPSASEAQSDCPPFAGEPQEVSCTSEGSDPGVRCEASGFGAALAIGDVDGNGIGDLLLGAPYAEVHGERNAGAVWIIPGRRGAASPLDLGRTTAVYGSGRASALLGMSIATLRTDGRDEPVAGAPGEARLYTFMCSAIEADVSAKRLCLPK